MTKYLKGKALDWFDYNAFRSRWLTSVIGNPWPNFTRKLYEDKKNVILFGLTLISGPCAKIVNLLSLQFVASWDKIAHVNLLETYDN